MAGKVKITWIKSGIGGQQRHRRTIRALGLHRLRGSVIKEDTPEIRGMINKVPHLVKVEELEKK